MIESAASKNVILQGIGVSTSVMFGRAFLMTSEDDRIVERVISEDEIPREIARFEEALIATRHQLHAIQEEVSDALGHESASIFDAHLLVVDDRSFVEEVLRGLSTHLKNVEFVLTIVSERYADALSKVEDDYLRERAVDVRDVARRILRNLTGQHFSLLAELKEPCIVIANDIPPSETATFSKEKVLGIATDLGSPSSHTAIMARAMGIPAVVGLHDVSTRISTGDEILIDGQKGILIIHPTQEQRDRYGKIARDQASLRVKLDTLKEKTAVTKDGQEIMLSCNIELPQDTESVLKFGGKGVGLFRTEFLYISRQDLPSEDEQSEVYATVARELAPAPVIIRTLDMGGDKFLSILKTPPEMNPFMGWRAIRFCLANHDFFLIQLRAILRASRYTNVKLMYPMISSVDEVIQANQLLERAKDQLRQKNIPFNEDIEVGIMIEIPSAALTAALMAPHVKFFSIGTNDLVQYTLAVDRVNERVAYLYDPTHPAIIKLIKHTIEVSHQHGIWAGICGEMAGNPILIPLLIGLGADELSVSPSVVPMAKDIIRNITRNQAKELARQVIACESSVEINERCRELVQKTAPEIIELVG